MEADGAFDEPGSGWRAALGGGLGVAVRDAIALFVSLRVVFGLVAIYLWWQAQLPGPCHFELARDGWTTIPPLADHGPAFPLVGVWQRWDACWYTKIATFGYEPVENSVNFWPLFPLLTGLTGRLLLGAMALGGLVVAGVGYVVAMIGLRRLVALDFDDQTALATIVAISIFPTAFFFFAPFTESLFLATAVWAILGARRRLWVLAAFAGLLAGLTRIQGVFLVLPLGWEAIQWWRAGGWGQAGRRWPARRDGPPASRRHAGPVDRLRRLPRIQLDRRREDPARHPGAVGRRELPPAVGGHRRVVAVGDRPSRRAAGC